MTYDDYKRELDLIVRQNNIELELYSIIACIMRSCENMKKLALREVSSMSQKAEYQKSFQSEKGFVDFIIADTSFSSDDSPQEAIKKIYGCIEAKAICINLNNTKYDNQISSELNKFGKLIYTNGIEWRYYELDNNNVKKLTWSVLLGKYSNKSIVWYDNAETQYETLIKNLNEIKWKG
ncbi:MAG: hypothetical protein NC177_05370 [Ruminococcus flavefaciens]|nr:hypothetical protein [Ruminococcus flavefaciens]